MRALPQFQNRDKSFWASVRSLSQHIGYSKKGHILTPTVREMAKAFGQLDLNASALVQGDAPTELGAALQAYFVARADILMSYVEPRLMTAAQAKTLFDHHRARLNPTCPIPMNKQKGAMKAEAYLTALVNMIIHEQLGEMPVNFDPRELTTFTANGVPVRTLARRVDGAFPSTKNPLAIWEIKEYYYTTTFGSRVADGVYETLLDGMELENLRSCENITVDHILIVDAHYTWWTCGKPYLCRMIDMLHMGYVSEILFGREVVEQLPFIVDRWKAAYAMQSVGGEPTESM